MKLEKLYYYHIDKLLEISQSEKMTAVSSKRLVMFAIETISSMRDEEDFNAVYDICLKEIKKLHFIEDSFLKQKGNNSTRLLMF